jgi:hypothetical protein
MFFLMLIFVGKNANSQVKFSNETDVSFYFLRKQTVIYDPGPGFLGPYLQGVENGFHLNTSLGITNANKRFFVGPGMGYLNLSGRQGYTAFANTSFRFFIGEVAPQISMKLGTSSVKNQYPTAKQMPFWELTLGGSSVLNDKLLTKLEFGTAFFQHSYFFVGKVSTNISFGKK